MSDAEIIGDRDVIGDGCEDDGVLRCAFSHYFSSTADIKCGNVRAECSQIVAFDDGACLDVQHCAAFNEDCAVQLVRVVSGPINGSCQLLIGDDGCGLAFKSEYHAGTHHCYRLNQSFFHDNSWATESVAD